uniref:Uncharacterized protein n=1 Tax=Trichobilharzia regenti TaxID=157069 RepID=A0AA85IW88_TRIRE|nr:unnamed protein product [Trichobilharzia regenti]
MKSFSLQSSGRNILLSLSLSGYRELNTSKGNLTLEARDISSEKYVIAYIIIMMNNYIDKRGMIVSDVNILTLFLNMRKIQGDRIIFSQMFAFTPQTSFKKSFRASSEILSP